MNRDRFDVLERYAPLFEMPEPSYERFLRRRDRKRRNQRIAAGVVGMALFVTAVLVVAAADPPDRSRTPASTGPTFIGPTTGPTVLPGVPAGSVGLPPEGAAPSTPERGSLVLSSHFAHAPGAPDTVELYLYEDGRLITFEGTTGFLEQRLTPEGVELLRSEALSTGLFDRDLGLAAPGLLFGEIQVLDGDRLVRVAWGDPEEDPVTAATPEQRSALERLDARLQDPASWLPATAWEDPTLTPYVAARYRVCYEAREEQAEGLDEVLAAIPGSAADLLRSLDRRHGEYASLVRRHGFPVNTDGPAVDFWCSALETEQALTLARILDDADVPSNGGDIFGIVYRTVPSPVRVDIGFEPMLPHE